MLDLYKASPRLFQLPPGREMISVSNPAELYDPG